MSVTRICWQLAGVLEARVTAEHWCCHNAGRLTWRLLVLSLWAQRGTATGSHRVCNIATTHGSCLAVRRATIKRAARIKG